MHPALTPSDELRTLVCKGVQVVSTLRKKIIAISAPLNSKLHELVAGSTLGPTPTHQGLELYFSYSTDQLSIRHIHHPRKSIGRSQPPRDFFLALRSMILPQQIDHTSPRRTTPVQVTI